MSDETRRGGLLYERNQALILNNQSYKHFESSSVFASVFTRKRIYLADIGLIRGIQSARADYDNNKYIKILINRNNASSIFSLSLLSRNVSSILSKLNLTFGR